MLKHGSASVREETPHGAEQTTHVTQTPGTETVINALKRRAQSILNDTSIDAQSRAIIRYGLETNDPWLAELVRRADAGEKINTIDFSETPPANEDGAANKRVKLLAEMICHAGYEPATKSAALLVLMARLENSPHPKALANVAKHIAFTHCGELNLCGMVDAEISILESELFTDNSFTT